MKFKLDENLPVSLVGVLSEAGHEAITVADQQLSGESDRTIATVCQQEDRVLLTLDTGFADIRSYPPQEFPGIIVLRLRRQDALHVVSAIKRIVPLLDERPVSQMLWVLEEHRIRFRS